MNRQRKKRECQPSDFNLLSSFFLEIGDDLGPIAIHVYQSRYNVYQSGYNENEREQEYRGDSHNDQSVPRRMGVATL